MKVILIQDVNKVGKAGEMKEVADGFARNMLFPKKLAVAATPEAVRALEFQKALKLKRSEKELVDAEEMAEKLDGREFVINAKVQEEGRLFGSINENGIIKKLKEEGFILNKKQIKLKKHIKEAGEHDLAINFDHGLEAQIKIIVEPEVLE